MRQRLPAELEQLEQPEESVLMWADPGARALEMVTGRRARRMLDDFDCRLAAASTRTSFQAGTCWVDW